MHPVTLLTATQGVYKPGESPAIEGKNVLKNKDFSPISKNASSFAEVGDLKIKERTKFNEAATPEDKGKILHNLAFGMKDKERSPSVGKYWGRFKDRFKDLAPVRWFQSNIKPKFVDTTSRSLSVEKPNRDEQKKNTRIEINFTGTAESKNVDEDGRPVGKSDFESKLVLNLPDLRGRTWHKKLWDKIANGGGVSVEQKINKFMLDAYQQIRLRNLGIDHNAEDRFASQKSGFLKSMESGKAPKLKDYSAYELKALKLHHQKGSAEATLIDKALAKIESPDSKVKISANEVKTLAKLLQAAEFKTISMIAKVAGNGAFTEAQTAALSSAATAIKENRSLNTLSSTERDQLKMLSIMAHSALGFSRVESKEPQTPEGIEKKTLENLKELVLSETDEVLPDDVICAPWIFSPDACAKQVKGLESLEIKNNNKQKLIGREIELDNQISDLSQVKNGASSGILEAQSKQDDVAEAISARKDLFEFLAESKGAMYRFQGVLPFLADKSRVEIGNNLVTVLKNAIEVSTGKQDDGDNLENYAAAFLAGSAAIAVGAHGAILPAVGLGAIAAYNIAQAGPSKDTLKFRQRLDGAVTAIYHAMVRGSEDAIFKANNILAEEVADSKVEKFCNDKINKLTEQSNTIADLNGLSKQDQLFKEIEGNSDGNRKEKLKALRNSLESKAQDLVKLKQQVKTLGKEIEAAPLKGDLEVHVHLTLESADIALDPKVKTALKKANEQNAAQCEILEKSLGIVKDFYSENGKLNQQVKNIETKIHDALTTSLFQGDPFEQIGKDIQTLRSDLIKEADTLTSEHAAHLGSIVDKIDGRALEAKNLRDCAQRLAKGIATPEVSYLSGKLDSQDLFKPGSTKAINQADYKKDLEALNIGINNFSDGGQQEFSIFTENTPSLEQLKELAVDVENAQANWNKCLGTMISMAESAKNPRNNNIHDLREDLANNVKDFNEKAKPLELLSKKYAQLTKQSQSDLSARINTHHADALRVGTANIIGLPLEARSQCKGSLDVLAGPLANPTIHKAIFTHLAGKEDKPTSLNELMAHLPPAGDPASFKEGDDEAWKSGTKPEGAKNFLSTLYNLGDPNVTDEAIETAGQICSSNVVTEVRGAIFDIRIDSAFKAASQNQGLINIFDRIDRDSSRPSTGLQMSDFKFLAKQVDTLVDFGLRADLKAKSTSLSNILDKYTDQAQRQSISNDDKEFLLRFVDGLKTLQGSPEATRRYQVKVATLNLLANIDEKSFGSLKDPKEVDAGKLKQVFEPKPSDPKQWKEFKEDFSRAEKSLGDIQGQFAESTRARFDANGLFTTNNGKPELLSIADSDQLKIRDNLLHAHRAYKTGNWDALLQDSKLTDLAKKQQANTLNKEIKKSGVNLEMLKFTDTENLKHDKNLKEFARQIESEQSSADLARNHLASMRSMQYADYKPVSEKVATYLDKYRVGPFREEPRDTVNRIFSNSDKPFLTNQLNALSDYIEADRALGVLEPTLREANEKFENFRSKRDGLLEKRQYLLFKNAVRSAILTYCYESSKNPADLQVNSDKDQIKAKLKSLGWSHQEYPIVNDLEAYFEEAKRPDCLETWTKEAGPIMSEVGEIDQAIKSALIDLNESLVGLNSEIKSALESRLSDIQTESDELAKKGGIYLETARAHAANLNGQQVPGNGEIAKQAIQELAGRLEKSHPVKAEVIRTWSRELSESVQSQMSWREISMEVSKSIDALQHQINETTTDNPRSYHSLLAATRALDFDRIADRIITRHFDSTLDKAENAYQAIQDAKLNFYALTAKSSLPKNLITDEKGAPRNWVEMYAKSVDIKNSKSVAQDFEAMHPVEFLGLFAENNSLGRFFASAKGATPETVKSLTDYMRGLHAAFGGMEHALNNFGLDKYNAAIEKAVLVLGDPKSPEVIIGGGDRLTSIGNILKESANLNPLGEAWNKIQVSKEKLIIRSEQEFNRVNKTFSEKIQEADEEGSVAAQDDYDLGEEGPSSNEAKEGIKLEIQENPPQSALSNIPIDPRIQQQIDAFQNHPPEASDSISIQQREGQINELENKKWTEALLKLGPQPTVQDYLSSQGFTFMKTDGDGDCYYNSIRHTTGESNVLETRQIIHVGVENFLRQIPQDQLALHPDLQTRFQNGFIKQKARGSMDQNAYGDISECVAVARYYDRPVVVLSRSEAGRDDIALNRRPIVYHPNGSQTDMTADMKIPNNAIVLVHSGGLHWDGAVPVK